MRGHTEIETFDALHLHLLWAPVDGALQAVIKARISAFHYSCDGFLS